jgi:hypothetical protein
VFSNRRWSLSHLDAARSLSGCRVPRS